MLLLRMLRKETEIAGEGEICINKESWVVCVKSKRNAVARITDRLSRQE